MVGSRRDYVDSAPRHASLHLTPHETRETSLMTPLRWTLRAAAAVLALVLLPLATAASAQGVTTGAISGTVTNEQGIGLGDVQIQVVNRGTGFTAGAMTRSNGNYTVPGLEVGSNYTVTARRLGFRPMTHENITVT